MVNNTDRAVYFSRKGFKVLTQDAYFEGSEDTRAYFRHRLREDRRQALMEQLRQTTPHSEWCDLDRGEDPTRDRDALAWRLERWALRRAALSRRAVAA